MLFDAPCWLAFSWPPTPQLRTTPRREQFNLFKQSHIGHVHIPSPVLFHIRMLLHFACRCRLTPHSGGIAWTRFESWMARTRTQAKTFDPSTTMLLSGPVCGLAGASPARNTMMYETTNNVRKLFAHRRRSCLAWPPGRHRTHAACCVSGCMCAGRLHRRRRTFPSGWTVARAFVRRIDAVANRMRLHQRIPSRETPSRRTAAARCMSKRAHATASRGGHMECRQRKLFCDAAATTFHNICRWTFGLRRTQHN